MRTKMSMSTPKGLTISLGRSDCTAEVSNRVKGHMGTAFMPVYECKHERERTSDNGSTGKDRTRVRVGKANHSPSKPIPSGPNDGYRAAHPR